LYISKKTVLSSPFLIDIVQATHVCSCGRDVENLSENSMLSANAFHAKKSFTLIEKFVSFIVMQITKTELSNTTYSSFEEKVFSKFTTIDSLDFDTIFVAVS